MVKVPYVFPLALIIALVLSACSAPKPPEPVYIEKKVYIYTPIEQHWFVLEKAPAPPSKERITRMTDRQLIGALSAYSSELMSYIKKLIKRIDSIKTEDQINRTKVEKLNNG